MPSARKIVPGRGAPGYEIQIARDEPSYISAPRPGHDVTISTANDPLSTLPTITP